MLVFFINYTQEVNDMVSKGKITDKLIRSGNSYMPPLPGLPLLELAENSRVMIENHCGVVAYSDTRISVCTRSGMYTVTGGGLSLAYMSRCQLIITGTIDSITVERRQKY